jgi:hypothetical protein
LIAPVIMALIDREGEAVFPTDETAYIKLDEELAERFINAHHKAVVLVGLIASPKTSKQKTATISGLVHALLDDTEEFACEVYEAYRLARERKLGA